MKIFYILYFILIFNKTQAQSNYLSFLKCNKIQNNLDSIKNSLTNTELIKLFCQCENSINLFGFHDEIAVLYFNDIKKRKAFHHLKKAFLYGMDTAYIDRKFSINAKDKQKIEKLFNKSKKRYLKRINPKLVDFLKELKNSDQRYRNFTSENKAEEDSIWKIQLLIDSNNIVKLKKYVKKNGWPSAKKYGYKFNLDPSLIVLHSNESNNLFFYPKVVKAAHENKTHWFAVENVMTNMLWRFQYMDDNFKRKENGFTKLYYTYLNDKLDEIDLNKSYIQIKLLAELLKTNNRDLEYFFVYKNESEKKILEFNTEKLKLDFEKKMIELNYYSIPKFTGIFSKSESKKEFHICIKLVKK